MHSNRDKRHTMKSAAGGGVRAATLTLRQKTLILSAASVLVAAAPRSAMKRVAIVCELKIRRCDGDRLKETNCNIMLKHRH